MTTLNISSNRIGWLSVPDGWETKKSDHGEYQLFKPPGGGWATTAPQGAKAEGIIAIADAISDMGALTSLNLASNQLNAEGAMIVAEAMKVTKCAIAVVPIWPLNCCCLLLSTGYGGHIEVHVQRGLRQQ
jgi:hypothetical protein